MAGSTFDLNGYLDWQKSMPAGSNFGDNLAGFYNATGTDPNANRFQGQLDSAFGAGNSPFLTYQQETANLISGKTSQGNIARSTMPDGTVISQDGDGNFRTMNGQIIGPTGSGGGAGGAGTAAAGFAGGGGNPYLGGQVTAIKNASQQFLDGALNGVRSEYVGNGGFGGSRDAVAQGTAVGQAANYLQSNLANLYGNAYNADQNRALQQQQINNSYALGNRGLDVQSQLGNRGYDLQGQQINNNYNLGLGQLDLGTTALGSQMQAQAIQNEWTPYLNQSQIYANYTGNGTTTQNSSSGGGASGAAAGALSMWQYGRNRDWW